MNKIFKVILTITIAVAVLIFVLFYVNHNRSTREEVGANGRDFIKSFPYFHIDIELDYMYNAVPNDNSLDAFRGFIEKYTSKSVSISKSEISSKNVLSYTYEDIKNIYQDNRGNVPMPFVISLYIIYLDSPYAGGSDENMALGMSFCSTCIAIFKPAIDVNGGAELESAVLAHEFMHILGFCGISYDDIRGHCDGNGHSKDSGSLIYELLGSTNISLKLTPDEIADLEDIRTGRL